MTRPEIWDELLAMETVTALKDLPGACIPIFHALQEEFDYVDQRAIPMVADALNLSKAEVVGVLNFYHDFRQEPPGNHILRLCRAEACQAMGADALIRDVETKLGAKLGETTADGEVTLEQVFCLGNCALSPAASWDGKMLGRVNVGRVSTLLEKGR